MLTSFVLTMALAAPVPVSPPAPAPGPVPRLLEVKAGADGKIMVTVMRTEMVKVQVAQGGAVNPGGNAPAVVTKEVPVTKMVNVELGDVKDLKVTTADGKKVDLADAVKQLKNGGVVVVSSDGKPVSPAHLKLFKDDVLVLTSSELIGTLSPSIPAMPGKPLPGRPIPLPAPVPPQAIPLNPVGGVIQIQIAPGQPGQIQILPAPVPAPQPAPQPAPEK
jgi:hypothetical protein